ncbi:MAG: cytochrome c biogenesis protein CcsA [Archangiaceae bacterium]|nr:cytochrome c biogenesis protein CcsA [Archangiaceae bacterium]
MPSWVPLVLLLVPVGICLALPFKRDLLDKVWLVLAAEAVFGIGVGTYLALFSVPPERDMGEVVRIFAAHVPQVQNALLAVVLNFGCSLWFLIRKSWVADSLAESSAEVGLYLGAVGTALGAIWAKPTWGVYWTWDPRLTSAAVMLIYYAGYLALRRFTDNPDTRATWSAALGTFGIVIPVTVYKSVVWMKSMHQVQSSPETVYPQLVTAFRFSAIGFLCLMIVFIYQRYRIAQEQLKREVAPPEALGAPQGAA